MPNSRCPEQHREANESRNCKKKVRRSRLWIWMTLAAIALGGGGLAVSNCAGSQASASPNKSEFHQNPEKPEKKKKYKLVPDFTPRKARKNQKEHKCPPDEICALA